MPGVPIVACFQKVLGSGKAAHKLPQHIIQQVAGGACPVQTSQPRYWLPPPPQADLVEFHHCFCVLQHSLDSCQATPSFPLSNQSFTEQMIKPQEGEGRNVE